MPQEKLIDDVMAFICEHGIVAQGYVGFRREDAKRLLARIGKAYADGELELPDEVGPRWEQYVYPCHEFADWCEEMYEADAKTLIALSGTAKEEEPGEGGKGNEALKLA